MLTRSKAKGGGNNSTGTKQNQTEGLLKRGRGGSDIIIRRPKKKPQPNSTIDFVKHVLVKLRSSECSHLFEKHHATTSEGWKFVVGAGDLVLHAPIVGRVLGSVMSVETLALVVEVDDMSGLITLCDGTILYDDSNQPDDALEGLGCNRQVKIYSIANNGTFRHYSDNKFVEWKNLTLRTSKLAPGSYRSISDINKHNYAERRKAANMYWNEEHRKSDKKKFIETQSNEEEIFHDLVDRLQNNGVPSPPMSRTEVKPAEETDDDDSSSSDDETDTPGQTLATAKPTTYSDDESMELLRLTKPSANGIPNNTPDWEFASDCSIRSLVHFCHSLITEVLNDSDLLCFLTSSSTDNLLQIRNKSLHGHYDGEDVGLHMAICELFGRKSNASDLSKKKMSRLFNKMFESYKTEKAIIPPLNQVLNMIPSTHRYTLPDGTYRNIDLSPRFVPIGKSPEDCSVESELPVNQEAKAKSTASEANAKTVALPSSKDTSEHHQDHHDAKSTQAESRTDSEQRQHRPDAKSTQAESMDQVQVPKELHTPENHHHEANAKTGLRQRQHRPDAKSTQAESMDQVQVPKELHTPENHHHEANAKTGTSPQQSTQAESTSAQKRPSIKFNNGRPVGLPTNEVPPLPGPLLVNVFSSGPAFSRVFDTPGEIEREGQKLLVEFKEVVNGLSKMSRLDDAAPIKIIEMYSVSIDELIGLPSALFAIKYCHFSNLRDLDTCGNTCSVFVDNLNRDFISLTKPGNNPHQQKAVGNHVLTKLRAESARATIHCIAFFVTTGSLTFATNTTSTAFRGLIESQRFKDIMSQNIATLFCLFHRWNPDAFPIELQGSGAKPFMMKDYVTNDFSVRLIYDTVTKFRKGVVSSWNERMNSDTSHPKKFIHQFACLAPFVLFREEASLVCDENCEHFAEITCGLQMHKFKTFNLRLKVPVTTQLQEEMLEKIDDNENMSKDDNENKSKFEGGI